MELLASLIGAPVNALTLFIAGSILFFQMVERGLIKIGKTGGMASKIDRLSNYYNHETSETLKRIETGIKELTGEQREHNKLEIEVHSTLKELKEYGIKCREK